jgi:hypothetical protein
VNELDCPPQALSPVQYITQVSKDNSRRQKLISKPLDVLASPTCHKSRFPTGNHRLMIVTWTVISAIRQFETPYVPILGKGYLQMGDTLSVHSL